MSTELKKHATAIVHRLREAGHEALFAGGCVRDAALAKEPSDYDIATSALPRQVESLFSDTVAVGRQFGVILVRHGGHTFEVATFREDAEYLDGRHPVSVRFSTAQDDARRRDFTINAMFEDPLTGTIHDYVGGRSDLEAGIVRAVGDPYERFEEDKLRLLRAVRFAARFGFEIEGETFAAMQRSASKIAEVSAERIGEELVRILTEGAARRGFELLDRSGLLDAVLPEMIPMKDCEQQIEEHPEGDVFVHTLLCLELLEAGCSETLALGLLLHDVGKPVCAKVRHGRRTFHRHAAVGAKMAAQICRRLRRSNAVCDRVAFLVDQHLRHCSARQMRPATLKRFLRQRGIEELLELARIDGTVSRTDLGHYEFCKAALKRLSGEAIRPTPLLRGEDLIALGLEPGPSFRQILRELEDAQLDGGVSTREEALALARKHCKDSKS